MRILILLTFFVGFLTACQQKPATSQALDLEDFVIVDIPGSDMKRATLSDVKGKIKEEGTILNGHKHGMWVIYHKDRDVPASVTNYVNGVPNGPMFEFGQYGHLEHMCSYTNNVLNGRFAKLKNIRKTEEGTFVEGILEGNFKKYYEGRDVVQQELNYKHNKLDGENIFYNDKGEVIMKYEYKDGEKISGGVVNAEATKK
ncbi:MAG: hypothetical protein K9J37_11130 [Saprospiraceae bacterium]|nr:hypothetical protein [Saprospiraceae bacterium]MCF8250459.1 hypothetical protein [Saprospiraceae bacterium]MCF8282763.1 hypothetical protein [Bacteroidales bacterium]MCF8312395.1 hypothetical protein [Saprospiraceae bacterium]MCF8440608.1 hypothetical protein [Saprospiraceae bacterium]